MNIDSITRRLYYDKFFGRLSPTYNTYNTRNINKQVCKDLFSYILENFYKADYYKYNDFYRKFSLYFTTTEIDISTEAGCPVFNLHFTLSKKSGIEATFSFKFNTRMKICVIF